jgi:glycosyltransferase involved in cell wall biosynthesis
MAGAPAGGAELFYERLCVASAQRGDSVLPIIRRDSQRAARLIAGGCAPIGLRFGGRLDLMTGWRVGRLLRGFAPRVVVAWMNRAARFTPRGEWVLAGRLGGFYDLSYYRRCDQLIGNTQGIVAWIVGQGWPAGRVHWLPNFCHDIAGATAVPREGLGVPPGVKLVLALGRLHRNKAFDVLIRAMRQIPSAHLVIAGEGPERANLVALAAAEGVAERVHMPGWVGDVAGLLAAAEVLVCPSRHEPLGNVVIEGWSAVRPVVASRVDGPAELIRSGRDGVLVDAESPGGLAEALCGVLERPAHAAALARAGRARFESEFAEAPVLARWQAGLAAMVAG